MQPQPLPPPGPPSRDEFSSFAAGYLVAEGQAALCPLPHIVFMLSASISEATVPCRPAQP